MSQFNLGKIPTYIPRKSKVRARDMNLIEKRLSNLEKTTGRNQITGLGAEEDNDFQLVELRSNLPILGMALASPLGFGPLYDEEGEEREFPAAEDEQDDSCFGITYFNKRPERNTLVHDIFSCPSWKGDRGLAVRSRAHDGRYIFIPDHTGDQWYGYNRSTYTLATGTSLHRWPGYAITSNSRVFTTEVSDTEVSGAILRKGMYLMHVSIIAERETAVPGVPHYFYVEPQTFYSNTWVAVPGGNPVSPSDYTPKATAPPYDNATICLCYFVKIPVKYVNGQNVRIFMSAVGGTWRVKPGGLKVHIQRCQHQHIGFGLINNTGYSSSGYRENVSNLRPYDEGQEPPQCNTIETDIEDLAGNYANDYGYINDSAADKQP